MISKKALIEGVLFASLHPVTVQALAGLFEMTEEEVQACVKELKEEYAKEDHGFSLIAVASGYQFRTKQELKEIMSRFYERKAPRLTQAMLEVLSIIAYKQPTTRPIIEKIRGVDCTTVLSTLLEKNLIEMQGRSPLPGSPVIYGTTLKFLEWFQIKSLSDLPPLQEVAALGFSEGTDHLLGLLNRDEGFSTTEDLQEVDQTLQKVPPAKEVSVPWVEETSEVSVNSDS